jgi:alkanesulfonate monooxygenase SsuD/methylene tetrahydromethanopterin reductase-like flavin-dependent oxidoreductase (luciferase family)
MLSVSLGLWQDRLAAEVVRTAQAADALGYGEIWIGEMATFDAFALGAVVAERTSRASLTIGPLAVAVRDPVMIAMGAGSLAELTGRTMNMALGSSSPVVVEQEGIATFKLPERLEIRDELLRNPLGKILKRELRDELRH